MLEPDDDAGVRDPYYIRASATTSDIPRLVVKCDDAFCVLDHHGDLPALPESEFGFYVSGTRFLRTLELTVHGQRPLRLRAAVSEDGRQVAVDMTNPDLCHGEIVVLKGRTLRLARRLSLEPGALEQSLAVENFGVRPHELVLTWHYAADFADVFEVRGMIRDRRGELQPPVVESSGVRLAYRGLDSVLRTTTLAFDPAPERLEAGVTRQRLVIPPGEIVEARLTVRAAADDLAAPATCAASRDDPAEPVRVVTGNQGMDAWLARAWADLRMLTTETPQGRIVYAGIPWFVAPFGRDSVITALQHVPFDADLARGTLRFLAAYQGREDDEFTDQSPGKILHEYRRGEMAACREIVFIPYYGSVDATPLFLMLVAEYLRWTDDRALIEELWPAVEAALGWLGAGPRADGAAADGYVTYAARSARGLVNQGWKDSHDAVMHEDGEEAHGPVALVEVQGYKFAALRSAAEAAEAIGRAAVGVELRGAADRLRARFERDYWMDEHGFYALALDGGGAPCRVVSSNPGHCLWTGLVSPERAARSAVQLMAPDMFTGWGVRTLRSRERRFNPMSYHNGSVWPHDTAIAAAGLRHYGFREAFMALATGLYEAARHCEGWRLPELFCGFERVPGYGPTPYPVACSPQAWAAGVVSQLLASMLGLEPDAPANRLTLARPALPAWLPRIELQNLRLGRSRFDLLVTRQGDSAAVEVRHRRGDAEIVVRH
jgi:glycogen debranching enzyme